MAAQRVLPTIFGIDSIDTIPNNPCQNGPVQHHPVTPLTATIPATVLVTAEKVAARRDGRLGVAPQPRAAAKEEAEGNVIAFKASPLSNPTNGHAS